MKKLKSTAKKLDVLAKIIFWICAVFGGITVVLSLIIAFAGESLLASATHSINLGPVAVELAPEYAPTAETVRTQFILGAILIASAVTVTCLAIRYIRNMLKPMAEERPFDGTVHKNMKKMAWLTLIGGGVLSFIGAACEAAMISGYNLQEIFASSAVTGINVVIKTDMSFIITFAVFYLLSCVFQYGEQLQIESDETL